MKTLCLFVCLVLTGCATLRTSRVCQPTPTTRHAPDTPVIDALTVIDLRAVCAVPWMGMCYRARDPQPEPIGRDKVRKWLSQFNTAGCCLANDPCDYPIVHRGTYTIYCQPDDSLRTYTVPVQSGADPKAPFIGRSTQPKPR